MKKTVFKILRNILFKQTEETSQGLAQVKPRVDQGKDSMQMYCKNGPLHNPSDDKKHEVHNNI